MTDDELRDILRRVAGGELDPDEAARLLDEADPEAGPSYADDDDDADAGDAGWWGDRDDDETGPPPPDSDTGERARELRVTARARRIRIVGDPSVSEVLVRGGHNLRRDGSTLVLDCDPLADWSHDEPFMHGFAVVGGHPWWGGRGPARERSGHWGHDWEPRARADWERRAQAWERRWERHSRQGTRGFDVEPVDVRMNPELPLTVDLSAGSARISAVRSPITCSLAAGSATLSDVAGPLECSVNAGGLTISGPISRGESRISCDMGSLKIRLEPGSDVRVKVDSVMSKTDVRLGDRGGRTDRGEWVVGDGTASLAISANMAAVKVREA
ncbi:MAG: hypothetical protein ACRD29_08620 [Acidimicrobiales bacterium]